MAIRNILCIGAGYVGGPTMSVIADRCADLRVVVADINAERVRQWNSDELPVYEPGLDAIVKRAMARDLEHRYPEWADFSRELADAFREEKPGERVQEFADSDKFNTLRSLEFFSDFSDAEIWPNPVKWCSTRNVLQKPSDSASTL